MNRPPPRIATAIAAKISIVVLPAILPPMGQVPDLPSGFSQRQLP
jgi:hypothetical protein